MKRWKLSVRPASEGRKGYGFLNDDAQRSEIERELARGERLPWILDEARRFGIEVPDKFPRDLKKEDTEMTTIEKSFRDKVITRLVELGKQSDMPGLSDPSKFDKMDDDMLITLFELVVVGAHRQGIQ